MHGASAVLTDLHIWLLHRIKPFHHFLATKLEITGVRMFLTTILNSNAIHHGWKRAFIGAKINPFVSLFGVHRL